MVAAPSGRRGIPRDLNLIYVDPIGASDTPGVIEVEADTLSITVNPGSLPTVHLLSSNRDLEYEFDVTITRAV